MRHEVDAPHGRFVTKRTRQPTVPLDREGWVGAESPDRLAAVIRSSTAMGSGSIGWKPAPFDPQRDTRVVCIAVPVLSSAGVNHIVQHHTTRVPMTGMPTKRDFLAIPDFSLDELKATLDLAARMKTGDFTRMSLAGKTLAMIFAKSSTRTRVSFEVGHRSARRAPPLPLLARHPARPRRADQDMARVLSRYVHGIVIRTFSHEEVEELAQLRRACRSSTGSPTGCIPAR